MRIKAEAKAHLDHLLDMDKEELVDMIADLTLKLKVEKAQSAWLDRLADHLRDHANSSDMDGAEESEAECDELYKEYQEVRKDYQSKRFKD